MTTDTTYNGWRNVETWRVQLHLANDEQTARVVSGVAREIVPEDDPDESLAGWLREYVTARVVPEPAETAGAFGQFASDTLQAALSRVDWRQIAAHWLEAARHELEREARA